MSNDLSDQEILELNELCSALVDETITEAQQERLSQILESSEEARRYYVRSMGLSASLHTYAAETQTDPVAKKERSTSWFASWFDFSWWRGLSIAATAVAIVAVYFALRPAPLAPDAGMAGVGTQQSANFVALVTGGRDPIWENGESIVPGDRVLQGQKLRLTKGIAEITFDSGARLTLEAPASLDVNSAWDATLRLGLVKASVPREAIGFKIASAAVDVVDLGTEFAMNAAPDGVAEVRVLKGEVEASPRGSTDQDTFLMRENETIRFASTGMMPLDDSDPALAHLNPDFTLDRFLPDTQHYRVTFDPVKASDGISPVVLHPTIVHSADESAGMYVESKHGLALRFDGNRYSQTKVPSLSSHTAHTIAFWVKVPRDASLADSYAMIAWSTALPKLNSRPVHISWNRTPAEGTLGAIRTDFGGGCAIGTTNLRDGRWHHIAIIFAPGDANTPLEVKQYVDGHLESGSIIPGQVRSVGRAEASMPLLDTLWIGSRIGAGGPRKERFRGEIAEMHITERGLSPLEIVSLMRSNQLSAPSMLAEHN